MLEELEASNELFRREMMFNTAHLLQDNGQFLTFLLKITGQWEMRNLPLKVMNRVNLFAEMLGVESDQVLAEAAVGVRVGNALFKHDTKLTPVIDLFASVHVTGELLLENARFFEHKVTDIETCIEIVRIIYKTDHFNRAHLAELFCLLNQKRLMLRGPNRNPMTKSKSAWSCAKSEATKRVLLKLGFSHAAISHCIGLLNFDSNGVTRIFEENYALFSKKSIAECPSDEQSKMINLLQYLVEKDRAKDAAAEEVSDAEV